MKILKTITIIILLITAGHVKAQEGVTVTITVENVSNNEGNILGGLYSKATFMKGMGEHNAVAPAKKGVVTLVFENVPSGQYAAMIMHDANGNQLMDREANGMPTEDWATSGDTDPFAPPVFEQTQFEVGTEDLGMRLRF